VNDHAYSIIRRTSHPLHRSQSVEPRAACRGKPTPDEALGLLQYCYQSGLNNESIGL